MLQSNDLTCRTWSLCSAFKTYKPPFYLSLMSPFKQNSSSLLSMNHWFRWHRTYSRVIKPYLRTTLQIKCEKLIRFLDKWLWNGHKGPPFNIFRDFKIFNVRMSAVVLFKVIKRAIFMLVCGIWKQKHALLWQQFCSVFFSINNAVPEMFKFWSTYVLPV